MNGKPIDKTTTQSAGDPQPDPIATLRRQILEAQKKAQASVQSAIASARRTMDAGIAAFDDSVAGTEQHLARNQQEVAAAFRKAQEVVNQTLLQFQNSAVPSQFEQTDNASVPTKPSPSD